MKYKRLGKSGLKVSQICLGTNNFGSQVNEEVSLKIIKKALDLGVNVIDTANVYSGGRSEKIIGKAVQGCRDDVIIATKVGARTGKGPNQGALSRKHILQQIKRSLESLGTKFIDIYYLHRFDEETPFEETLRTLNDLVHNGKVRYVACSNFTAWQIAKAHEICEIHDLEKFVAVQPEYNLLHREIEKDLLPYCQQEGLGVLTYSPLKGGFLTGKYRKNTPPMTGSRAGAHPQFWERVNMKENFIMIEPIRSIAAEVGISMIKLAIMWIMKNPLVTAPIVGASSVDQIEKNCQITEINIDNSIYQRLDEITKCASVNPLYS